MITACENVSGSSETQLRNATATSNSPIELTHVLLVEDDPTDLLLTTTLLRETTSGSFQVQAAGSLAEAIQTAGGGDVDVVLLDLGLPDSFGIETFEQFHNAIPHFPVIVLSGQADETLALKAVQGGAQDYLVKGQTNAAMLVRSIRYAVQRKRIELALEQEHALFQTLMENIPDSIYFKDRQSRFLRISHAQARLFGLKSPEEALGKTDFDMFTEEHARPAFEDEQEVMRTGKPLVGKVERETLTDGRLRWALTTKMPFRDKEGRIIGTFGISKDITEIKLMEEVLASERNLLRTVIDSLPDHIYVKDTNSRFILCNNAVARFFGLGSHDEIVGKSDFDFFPEGLTRQFQEEEQELLRGETPSVNREVSFADHQGQTHWVITTKVPMRDRRNRITGLVGINRDISERKRAEEQLHQLNADLARSQKELFAAYADLKRTNEELKATQWQLIQAEKLESIGRLAAGVAHEVKNPLATILMGVEYLGDTLKDASEDVAMTLGQMQESIKRADAIVRGLLDVASAGRLELTETNLNGVIEQSLLLVRHELRQKDIQIIRHLADNLPAIRADRRKMEQVFINLFLNAIQVMPQMGELRLRTEATTDKEGRPVVVAVVEDNGPGIPPEVLPRIFDPFFSTKPTGMGAGLGLTVVRNILDLHGGRIEISNRPEGGARAAITFRQ